MLKGKGQRREPESCQVLRGIRKMYELQCWEIWPLNGIVLRDLQMIHTDLLELAGHILLPHSCDTGQGMAGKDRGQMENTG